MNQSNLGPMFHFPFQPYSIQEKFMKELYFTIQNNKSGIFESPTGTGKSLSICCSVLQWLHDHNKAIIGELQTEIAKLKLEVSMNNGSVDWLQEEYEKIQKNQLLCTFQLKWSEIKKRNEKFLEMKKRVAKQKMNNGSKHTEVYFNNLVKHKKEKELDNDDQIKKENIQTESSEDNDLILEECGSEEDEQSENEELPDEIESNTKIYISSRTHSQLSQFIVEIKQTVFNEDTRVVTLASRQHYCINPDVLKLKNVNLINERCLDLQKSKTKSTSVGEEGKVLKKTKTRSCTSCPYYNQTNINRLKERILTEIMDMEDLVKCAKELKGCPYYASRAALDDAEVALVSHAGIVSSGARSGMSLKLKDNILIMDEAHGLTAALENAHSAPVSMKHLSSVKTFLQLYINKYRARLSSQNLLWLNQMQYVVGRLLGMLKSGDKNQESPSIFTLEDFVIEADIDHLKLTPLIEMCRKSKLAPKLHGFSMRYTPQMLEEEMKKSVPTKKNSLEKFLKNISKKKENDENATQNIDEELKITQNVQVPAETSPGTGLYAVLDFLQMLCDRSENGRILVKKGDEGSGQLKYLLLNPAEHFVEVVKQCRSVIVAGGTMEPIGEFVRLLTGTSESDDVTVVKCDHVVSPENVLAVCMNKGPSNVSLNFSYEQRGNSALLTEIGRILRNVCNVVPGGVVCFLPSYAYEQIVYEHLKKAGVIEAVNKKKTVFREPKSAADVEQVLSKYATAVRNKSGDQNGALLLSVVGGKLSEGLNFSDDLGRCVIVVGMPYPNKNSPELKEKMSYLNRTVGAGAGNAHYESLCMKAVNQCIGRAVRHAKDYACVLLLDERYSRPHVRNALPSFVQKSLLDNCPFGKAFGSIGKFFTKHKEKSQCD